MDDDVSKHIEAEEQRLKTQAQVDRVEQNLNQNAREAEKRTFSSGFFTTVADADVDSDVLSKYRNVEDTLPATFSNAHLIGQRDPVYAQQQELLNRAKAERYVAERRPGAILERRPGVHAVMRGDEPRVSNPPMSGKVSSVKSEVPSRMDAAQRRVIRSAIREIATTRQSLAVGGTGIRQFTSATSETHRVDHSDDDGGILSSATGVFS